MAEPEVVSTFERDRRRSVLASITEYRGEKRFDVRLWFRDEETGELRPTKQGISLPVGFFEKFRALVLDLDSALRQRGFI